MPCTPPHTWSTAALHETAQGMCGASERVHTRTAQSAHPPHACMDPQLGLCGHCAAQPPRTQPGACCPAVRARSITHLPITPHRTIAPRGLPSALHRASDPCSHTTDAPCPSARLTCEAPGLSHQIDQEWPHTLHHTRPRHASESICVQAVPGAAMHRTGSCVPLTPAPPAPCTLSNPARMHPGPATGHAWD